MTRKTIHELAADAENALGIDIVVTTGRRAAYYASETGGGYWLTRADLAYAVDCAREYDSCNAYSHWCAGTGKQMAAASRRAIFGR